MEIIGRLVSDAKVNELKDRRKVVNFSIVVNEHCKVKDSREIKKFTTYLNCSYWVSDRIAKALTKGTLVELHGRVNVSTYTNSAGEVKATLNFHVNNIKLHGKPAMDKPLSPEPVEADANENTGDDLPF